MSRPDARGTRTKWRKIIQRYAASGLSAAAFCRSEGLAESSFFAWKRRLGPAAPAGAFVEAKLAGATDAGRCSARRHAPWIELVLRGRRVLRLRPDFDAGLLRELVRTLEALA